MNFKLRGLISVLAIVSLVATSVSSQCPDGANVTTNGHCLVLSWMPGNIPDDITMPVFADSKIYFYVEGSGAEQNPAIYQGSGGNGACNAGQGGFSGPLIIGGEECEYNNGVLIPPPLPVTLISFTVHLIDNEVVIKWSSTAEINNDFYSVDRSTDGLNWKSISTVAGSNLEEGIVEYEVLDEGLSSGTYYYRLSQQDFDGRYRVIGLQSISTSVELIRPTLVPNPASDILTISGTNSQVVDFFLFDLNGRMVAKAQPGSNAIELGDLTSGMYVARITQENGLSVVEKVVVEH